MNSGGDGGGSSIDGRGAENGERQQQSPGEDGRSGGGGTEVTTSVELLSHYDTGNAPENSSGSSPASNIDVDVEKGAQKKCIMHHQQQQGIRKSEMCENECQRRSPQTITGSTTIRQNSINDDGGGALFYNSTGGVTELRDNNNNDHVINQNETDQREKDKIRVGTPISICDASGYGQSSQGGCISDFVRSMWYNPGHNEEIKSADHNQHHLQQQHQQQQQHQHQGYGDTGSDQVVVSNGMDTMQLGNVSSFSSQSCPNSHLILPPPPLPPNVARPVTIIRSTSDSGVAESERQGLTMESNGEQVPTERYETKEFFKKYDSLAKSEGERVLKRKLKKKTKNELIVDGSKEWISSDLVLAADKRNSAGDLENHRGENEDGDGSEKRKYRKYLNGASLISQPIEADSKQQQGDVNNGIGASSIALLTEFSPFQSGATATLQMYATNSPGPTGTTAAGFITAPHELYPFQTYEHGGHILSVDASGNGTEGQDMIIPTNLCLYPSTTSTTMTMKSGVKQGLHRLTSGGFLVNNCDSENDDFLINLEQQQQQHHLHQQQQHHQAQQHLHRRTHSTEICILDPNGEWKVY